MRYVFCFRFREWKDGSDVLLQGDLPPDDDTQKFAGSVAVQA